MRRLTAAQHILIAKPIQRYGYGDTCPGLPSKVPKAKRVAHFRAQLSPQITWPARVLSIALSCMRTSIPFSSHLVRAACAMNTRSCVRKAVPQNSGPLQVVSWFAVGVWGRGRLRSPPALRARKTGGFPFSSLALHESLSF